VGRTLRCVPELLTGTVTFFFSDIEGSTLLLRETGDRWPAMLERHQELIRASIAAHDGREVGTEGDSFFASFPTAPGAMAAAVDVQKALAAEPWPEGADLRVRIGLHTGEASLSASTYVGLHVHRASRIASAGHGGQVLLSDATRSLVADELPDGVTMRDLGEHRLKDLEHPERLWQLVIEGLQADFPAISSLDATPNNLPTSLTTFLGRDAEIEAIGGLLNEHRLLTLTGPGGTGKTRLSLEVAGRMLRRYPDGIWFVELATISDPELVPSTIAQTLGLPERGGRPPMERLIEYLSGRSALLVLDNLEQVIDAGASVNELLASCPKLTILTSSRSALQVSGEQEYPVPPLDLPDPSNLPPLAQLSQYEAVALFIERARAVKPGFEVTNENAPAVAEICVRLDGLPLAIELAAARIRVLTPQAMLGRLGDRLGLLSSGARDLPERQQTLRGAIAWSHGMLEESDRELFARLSVFVGGAGLEEIDRVCSGEGANTLDGLTSLTEKSLVRQTEGAEGEPRFTMLETIREFAIEKSQERGQWEALRERHAGAFAALAHEAASQVMGVESRSSLDRLELEHDNLRAALAWAMEHDTDAALRLCHDLWRFWQRRGHLAEGLERAEAVLALPDAAKHPEARADALSAAAGLAYWRADADRARTHYVSEIEARTALGDRKGLAEAHYGISFTYSVLDLANPDTAANASQNINAALEIFTELGDQAGIARCEWGLANVLWGTRQTAEARTHALNALQLFEASGDRFMAGWSAYTAGLADLSIDQETSGGSIQAREDARRHLAQAMRTFREAGDLSGYTLVLDAFAVLAVREGDRSRAARLTGVVGQLEKSSGTALNPWNRGVLDYDPEALRKDPALADDLAIGAGMSVSDAVAYALGEEVPEAVATA
jgi:predicted ATPase/class 3 adenylate cyclase